MSNLSKRAKPYRVRCAGVVSIVWAASAAKARYCCALSAQDAGFVLRANPVLVACRRALEFDHIVPDKIGVCYSPDNWPGVTDQTAKGELGV